jgi:transposase
MAGTLGADRECCGKTERGSTSRLEEHADWLLELIEQHLDLTLEEIAAVIKKLRITSSRSAVFASSNDTGYL